MNNISLISVAELLDGRNFFVPAYQRGYRWGKDQMWELLDDLYEFSIRDKKEGEFYCLQPVIVQPITDDEKLKEIKSITGWGDEVTFENTTWEVIDGQQRLTSIYILFRYLVSEETLSLKRLKKDGKALYRLCYETRPKTKDFLEELDEDSLNYDNIDATFISKAYLAIDEWLKDRGPAIAKRYGKRNSTEDILQMLYNILRTSREDNRETSGSAQFIWYELQADSTKNPIDEFISINNGKIRLTDAELIKGLFLQKRNFSNDQSGRQMRIAMQWEDIENTLHKDDFWTFLSRNEEDDNRIETLFSLTYQKDKGVKPQDGNLFRHYYELLTGSERENELEQKVEYEWERIVKLFHVLSGWYEDPVLYNTIGFLIHSGVTLSEILTLHDGIDRDAGKSEFIALLNRKAEEKLPGRDEVKKNEIGLTYGKSKRHEIRSLLLFLNIYQLNKQMNELRKNVPTLMSPIYKFPFDLFVSQQWDVEHIDSATTNDLRSVEDKEAWLIEAINALNLKDDEEIMTWLTEKNYDAIWTKILQRSGTSESSDTMKNSIGNLTLLDAETNRGYGNHIFALKRKEIQRVIQSGTFVPICTQMVFNKGFESQDTNLRAWTDKDKECYTAFVVRELKSFYNLKD